MTVPKRKLPRITEVRASKAPLRLDLVWDNGLRSTVDVSRQVATFRLYAPLRDDAALFRTVRRGDVGSDVIWGNDIDMSADILWQLTLEQSGLTMSAIEFRAWRDRHGLTLDGAAEALGISRRMLAYYESGSKPVPRVVALATRGLEASQIALTSAAGSAQGPSSARR